MTLDKSAFDYAVDFLLERQRAVIDELRMRFKRTKPFRKEPVSSEESLYYYSQMTPEFEIDLRQAKGDAFVDDYIQKMQNTLARRKK